MLAYIQNNNGKYITEVISKDNTRALIRLSDRNIPLSKFEWVLVKKDDNYTKKKIVKIDRDFYYFNDETKESKDSGNVKSNKPDVNTGYYIGFLENYYFDPENPNKTVKGENLAGRTEIVIREEAYNESELRYSHSYFKITRPVDKTYLDTYLTQPQAI